MQSLFFLTFHSSLDKITDFITTFQDMTISRAEEDPHPWQIEVHDPALESSKQDPGDHRI